MAIKLLPLPKEKVIIEPPRPPAVVEPVPTTIPVTPVPIADDLPNLLKRLYPEMFLPEASFGFTEEEKPAMVLQSLLGQIEEYPEDFLKDLMGRGKIQDAESLLRMLGATEEDIDELVGVEIRQNELETLVTKTFPGYDLPKFVNLVETDFGKFVDMMQTGGQTADKLALLNRGLGIPFQSDTELDIQDIFQQIKIVVPIDDVRQLVTITPDGKAYNQEGQWVGTYNRAAQGFTAAKTDEGFIKDSILDPWCFAANRLGHGLTQFGASVLPNILFRDLDDIDRKIFGDDWVDKVNAGNKVLRDRFRGIYAANQKDFDEWIVRHPELIPKPKYEEGLSEHPELLLDPAYFAYEFMSTAPISLGVMALVAGGFVTGQPALGVLAGAILMTPAESADAYQTLLNAGAPEDEAAPWALLIGTSASLIETFSDLFFLKVVAAPVAGLFRKEAVKQMSKATVGYCLKKGVLAFTETSAIEVAEEVLTLAISNAVLKVYNENVNIWDDMVRTAAKTFAAVAPTALFAGASTMVGISRQQAGQFTDTQKLEKGWLQDPASKEWLRPMTSAEITLKLKEAIAEVRAEPERGAIIPGAEPREVTPVTPEGTLSVEEVSKYETRIPLDLIRRDEKQTLARLTEEIKKEGIKEPITIRIREDGSRILWDGIHRFIVAQDLGIKDIPVQFIGEIGKVTIPKAVMPEAPYTAIEVYEKQQELAGLKEWFASEPAAKLVSIVKRTGWRKGEVSNLTITQYKKLSGKEMVPPAILTADKKHVMWEYALDSVATEMGYKSGEELRYAIEGASESLTRIQTLEAELKGITPAMIAPEVPAAPPTEVIPPTEPPTPSAPAVTAGIPTPPVSPTEIDRIITLSKEQVRQNRPGVIVRILDKIPGVKQLLEFERPGLKMTGEREKVLVAMVAETQARSDVATRELATRLPLFKKITELFGKDSLHGGRVDVEFIGKEEDAVNPITNTLKDIMDNPWVYDLSPSQRKFIVDFNNRNNEMLLWVVDKYGAEIGRYVPYEGGAYLPNVDISEDIVEYLGSETQAIARGRGKARIWQTARERMASDKTFKPEIDVQKLVDGMDSFKASAAGGITYREAIGGLTRLEMMEKTHPKLYDRMMALRKELQSLQGSAGTIESNVHKAIFDFLNSPVEDADLATLRDSLDVKLKSGPRVMFNVEDVQNEIAKVREQIKELRPAWEAANPKPYVFVQEGLFRYFPSDQAKLILDSRRTTNNPALRFIERWRGGAFSGDFSPFAIQGMIGVAADPVGNLKAAYGGVRSAIEHQDWLRSFSVEALADDIAADPDGWAEYASLMGRQLAGTPMEYSAGFLSLIPGFNKFTESTYITVTRESKAMWDRDTKQMIKSGVPEIEAKVAAIENVNKVYPLVNPRVLGQSPSRTALLRALPTSYSFIRQPASLIANATKGYAKLATLQPLTAQEKLSVKRITIMAISVLIASATSAALTAVYRKKTKEEILQAILDAINPDPYNGKFASVILPIGEHDVRIPLGGPYRAIFRAIYPQEVEGIPFPVPFYGLLHYNVQKGMPEGYLWYRITPAIRTQLDLMFNKDYFGNQIIKGQFIEQVIRGLLYEFEEMLPLSIGSLAEDIRQNLNNKAFRGKEFWEIRNDVIGQFMGVNVITLDNTYFDRRIRQLGLFDPTKTIPLYSTEKPLYQTNDLWGDTIWIIKDMTAVEIAKRRFPVLIQAIGEAKIIKDEVDLLRNHSLTSLNADVAKGDTFVVWYQQWLAREKITDPDKLTQFDKDNPQAYLGNMSFREYDALSKYLALKESNPKEAKVFLEAHPELTVNPRNDWLKSHPKENAQLAVWGQAKILTKEAYNQFKGLLKTLDIPDSAIPPLTLPPETSIDTHFKYEEMVTEGIHGSWEAQLLLLKDAEVAKEAGVQSYAEWKGLTLSDTPPQALELKIKGRDLSEQYDALETDEERLQFKTAHPEWVDDTRRIEAIEKGTEKVPTPDVIITNHIDYMKMQDAEGVGSSSASVMLYRVDNPDYNTWRMDVNIWGDQALKPIDLTRIPIWRIDVKYAKEDAEYDTLPTEGNARANYLADNDDYRLDRRRREAYQKGLVDQVENYVAYYELPVIGYRQERFLFNNPDFANALGLKIPDRVPSEQYDILLEKEDKTPEDLLRMDAYKLYVPDEQIENYVGYYSILATGKPKGQDLWYEDDWFMIEHPDFYKEVYLGILENERKDYRKVPTREVFAKYLIYLTKVEGKPRQDYRFANLDLDEWGQIAFGWKSIKEQRIREELTPTEKFKEEIGEREKSAEEILREIEEGLAKLRKK